MINEYRFKLEKARKKNNCPDCGKKTFVRYIDTKTGSNIQEQYGRCDREIKCSYHLNPYQDGHAKIIREQERGNFSGKVKQQILLTRQKSALKLVPVYIPTEVLKNTLKSDGYIQNIFIQNLMSRIQYPFETIDMEKVISQYYLGTISNGYRAGAITFPFIDKDGNVRTIQVKQFDQDNKTTGTDFLHSIIEKEKQKKNEPLPNWLEVYQKNDLKVSCLFGEHLLSRHPLNPIALVEAPKTAIYGTLYFGFPDNPENLLWMAVYNLSSLNYEKCKELKGRDVYLFPDLSKGGKAFDLWSRKAKELSTQIMGTRFEISNLLENEATEIDRSRGLDFADFLIKQDWRKFRPQKIEHFSEKTISYKTPQEFKIEQAPYSKSEIGEKSEAVKTNYIFNSEKMPDVDVSQRQTEKNEQPPIIQPLLDENSHLCKQLLHRPEYPEPQNNCNYSIDWKQDITELEDFFSGIELSTQQVKLKPSETIINISKFIESHLATIKANNGNTTFLPFLHRLQELKEILSTSIFK